MGAGDGRTAGVPILMWGGGRYYRGGRGSAGLPHAGLSCNRLSTYAACVAVLLTPCSVFACPTLGHVSAWLQLLSTLAARDSGMRQECGMLHTRRGLQCACKGSQVWVDGMALAGAGSAGVRGCALVQLVACRHVSPSSVCHASCHKCMLPCMAWYTCMHRYISWAGGCCDREQMAAPVQARTSNRVLYW